MEGNDPGMGSLLTFKIREEYPDRLMEISVIPSPKVSSSNGKGNNFETGRERDNEQTIADSSEAQTAVAQALTVLASDVESRQLRTEELEAFAKFRKRKRT